MSDKNPLYGDDFRESPPEETPVIKNRFATDPGLIDFSTAGELEFKKQKRRKEMVDSDLPYSKTPEELESTVEDSRLQRQKWELASMLSQKKAEIESIISSIPENTGNPEENAFNNVERNKLISTLTSTQKQLEELKPDSIEEQKSTLDYILRPIQDTYDVWKEVLQTGEIWEPHSKRTKEARENFKELELAFFKGSTGILASSLQGIAILGNAWDKYFDNTPYTDFKGNYSGELEDSPIFRLGKYLSEQTAPVGDESLLTDLMRAQGSMAGFILGGELLAPIKGIAPTNQLLQQVFSRMGNVAITGGFAQYPEEYLKALEITKDQSKATWIGALNFVGGMTEALPIEAFLEKLTASTGTKFLWQKALKDMSIQGTEEGLQEMFQQFLANASAQQIYDASRELLEGVAKGGAIGFLSGMLMSGTIGLKQIVDEKTRSVENRRVAENFINEEGTQWLYDSEFKDKIEKPTPEKIASMSNSEVMEYANYVAERHNEMIDKIKSGDPDSRTVLSNPIEQKTIEQAKEEEKYNETLKEAWTKSNKLVKEEADKVYFYNKEAPKERTYTPENVTSLQPNQVFVFGSNTEGRHGKGAALLARNKFGAKYGQSKGLQGQSYGIVTKNLSGKDVSLENIADEIYDLNDFAKANPSKEFLVTKLGTGLAGHTVESIKDIWREIQSNEGVSDNIVLPKEFEVRDELSTPQSNEVKSKITPEEFEKLKKGEFVTREGKEPETIRTIKLSNALEEVKNETTDTIFKNLAEKLQNRISLDVDFKDLELGLYGRYRLDTGEFIVNENISKELKHETILHETLHAFTAYAIISKDSSYHNESLYNQEFRDKIQELYDAVDKKYSIPTDILATLPKLDRNNNVVLSKDDIRLIEFITYGLTSSGFRNALASTKVGKTGKSAWSEFIHSIWNYLKDKLGFSSEEFSESALNNLVVAVSEYVDQNFPTNQDKIFKEEVVKSNLKELQSPTEEFVTNEVPLRDDTAGGVDYKFENLREVDNEKVWKGMSSSKIVSEFTDKNGKQFYISAEQMYVDLLDIYRMARNKINESNPNNLGVDEVALEIFKSKYENEALERVPDKDDANKFSHIENVFLSMKNKRVHKIVTLKLEGGKIELVNHNSVYPTSDKKQTSVIYDKRFYEMINEQVSKALGKKVELVELKNHKAFLKEYNKGKYGEEQYDESDLMTVVYKNGYALMPNKSEMLLVKIDSILTPEELKTALNIPDVKPTTDGQKVSTYIFNKYWSIAFNPTLNPEFQPSQAALMKRMANLQGKAPNTLITPELRKMLELDKTAMRIDGDKLMVRTVELDAKNLPDYLKNHLKETLGKDWYKDELVGDGAIISLPEVHNMGNMMNGVPTKDWGLLSKYKTFEVGEQLLKCADQKAFMFSELYKWMRWNRVGKVILSTARKVKSGQPQISWDQITNNTEINESQIYEYDMRQDAFQSSHGEVKTETRGLMSSYVTTMLSSYMSPEVHQALMSHLKSHINQLKTKTLDNLDSFAFIKKEMESFMKSQADLFESKEQQFISNEVAKNDKFVAVLQAIDYFKQNILSKRIQYTLQHEESYGSLPALCADLGQIGGFKDFFVKQYLKKNKESTNEEAETEASKYFDKHGFINPGYCVVDELTYKKIFSNKKIEKDSSELMKVIVGCNPPASLADIRALEIALVIPNGTFEGQIIDTNFLAVNIKQFQALSGKDFDIDKVPILNAERTPDLKTLWDFLHKLNPDAELERFAKEFATWDMDDPYFKESENRIDEIEKLVGNPTLKGKIDGPLAHIIKLFGANKDLKDLDITKPSHFIQLAPKLSDNYIGRLYNVRLTYTAMLEVGKPIEFIFSSKKLKIDKAKVTVSTNMKKQSYNKGLLYYLTNYTLDWLSDQKLLAFNYDPALLNMILYDVEINGKPVLKSNVANEVVMEMYNRFLKPSRMLLRRPEVEDKNIKDYAELKSQLLDAYFSLYTGNMVTKDNPFNETTVIKTTRDFIQAFTNSKVGALGLQEEDIRNFFSSLKETIMPKNENDIKAEQEAIKYGTPLSHLAKILNRFHDLGAKVPTFVTETGSLGRFKEENNEGGMSELWFYSNKLRESGLAPSTHYLFNEFFTDYLTKDIMIVRQSKISRDVVISSTGTSVGRDYVVHLNAGDNKVTYRIDEWIKKPNPNNKNKVIKEVKKSTQYKTYQEVLNNQGSYQIDDIINNMTNEQFKPFIYSFGSMFMIKGNSGLKRYLSDKFFDLYKNVASEIQTLDINHQRLFFKLGTSIYDLENPDQQYLGARYRLAYYRDSKGITNLSDRTNLKIRDISPYMMYLDKAGEVNPVAKELYGQIVENLIDSGLKMYKDRLDKMANGNLLPIYFFNRPITWPKSPENTKKLKNLVFEVDQIVDKISTIYSDVIKPFQIVNYWNHYAKGQTKISEDQIDSKHREFYLQDFAESFLNYKISFEAKNPKKSYEAKLEAYEMLEKALKNPNMKYDKYSKLSNKYAKTKPAIHAIRSHSARNIPLMPTEKIPYCINGFIRYFTPHELAQEFLYTSHRADEPFMASGSMITQNILRRINDGYNDLGKKQKKLYNDLLDALFHSNPDIKFNPAQGEQFLANLAKRDMFDIAEGADAQQVLRDISFNARGQLVVNKSDVYDIASITNSDGTVKWNLKTLTQVAEAIAIKYNMFLNTNDHIRNKELNAVTQRALIGALMQRWIYDYYVENRIRRNMMQIEAIMSTANTLNPATAHTVRSWGNDFLNKNRGMLKQVSEMRKNLKKEGKHYMPHMWDSAELYEKDLVNYYVVEKKLTQEAAEKKVKDELEAENKESLYTGIPSIKSHVNFKHRDNLNLKLYSRDITVLPDYLSILSLMFRQQSLQMYEELTKEYTQYDNVFSRMNMIRQFSLTKNQSALYRPIQSIDQVSKGDFVMFEFIDKSNRPLKQKRARFVSFKGTKGEVIKGGPGSYVIPQREKEPESSKIIHGEVLKVKDGKIQVRIFNISPDEQVVETFSQFEIKNLSLLDPIFMSKEVQMYIYKKTGHLTEKTSLIDVFAKVMVGLRNVTLLGLKPYYWLRNKIGSGQIGKSYLSSYWYNEGKKLVKTWTTLTPAQRDGLPDYEKNMWRVIENAGTSIFGDVNEIMGRIGMDLSVQEGLMTPEKYKVAVEMNKRWETLREELQPIADEINADRSVINGAPRWTDTKGRFMKRIFADGALKEFYAAHELYSIPFNLANKGGSKNLEINPAVIEAENRTQTVMTIMAWYKATMMETSYLLTEEEQAIADDFLRQKLVSVIKGHVNLIEGKYVQGIDLAFYDTPGWGRFWNQFFHFTNNQQNGLGSTIGSMQDQIVKFGFFNVINSNNEIQYIERIKDMNTGEVIEVRVEQMNAFRQALKVSIRAVVWGLIRSLILASEGTLIGAALNSTGLSVLKLFTLGAFADSISIPVITGLMNLLTYILQAQVSTAPGNDDDKEWFTNPITGQKVSIKFKKRVLQELLGSNEDEFIAREIKRIQDKGLDDQLPLDEVERLTRNWYRKQMGGKVLESLPFGGVGLSQAYDLLLSVVFTEGDMDQLVEQLIRDLTVTLVPGAPIVIQVSQAMFPTFFYRSDPYLTEVKRAQYRANLKTREKQLADDKYTESMDQFNEGVAEGTVLEGKTRSEVQTNMEKYKSSIGKAFESKGDALGKEKSTPAEVKEFMKFRANLKKTTGDIDKFTVFSDFKKWKNFLLDKNVRKFTPAKEYNTWVRNFGSSYNVPEQIIKKVLKPESEVKTDWDRLFENKDVDQLNDILSKMGETPDGKVFNPGREYERVQKFIETPMKDDGTPWDPEAAERRKKQVENQPSVLPKVEKQIEKMKNRD